MRAGQMLADFVFGGGGKIVAWPDAKTGLRFPKVTIFLPATYLCLPSKTTATTISASALATAVVQHTPTLAPCLPLRNASYPAGHVRYFNLTSHSR